MLAEKNLTELKAIANELNIEYDKNVRKADLITLIELHNNVSDEVVEEQIEANDDVKIETKELTLDEIMELSEKLTSEITFKRTRNDEIVVNNKYLDERIAEIKSSDNIGDAELKQIENLNKIKAENSRQYAENTKKIIDFESQLMDIDSKKTKLAHDEYTSNHNELKVLSDELSLYPEVIAKKIAELHKEYKELQLKVNAKREDLLEISNKFGLKVKDIEIEQGKLTVSEKAQLVRRIGDLSKISERLESR
ncbi:MAG: Rho termination factor N-terminal domain-containing protein [Cetobacterium sp.]